MNLTEAILLLLRSEGESVQGRTLLQKRMYFYGVLSKQDFGFRPHYYGPYSSRVAAELDGLVAASLITDKPAHTGGVGTFGEVVRHDYELLSTDALEDWSSERDASDAASLFERIANHSVAKNTAALSAAAKVHFILSSGDSMSFRQVEQKASELGWNLPQPQIQQVAEYLKYLELIKVQSPKKTA